MKAHTLRVLDGPNARAGCDQLVTRHRTATTRRRAVTAPPAAPTGLDQVAHARAQVDVDRARLLERLVAEASLTTSTTGA